MYPVSCTNTLHDVKKYKNLNIVRTEHNSYYETKKFLTCESDGTF